MLFSNHSCNPNIGVQGQIVFVALRHIRPGEELTHDWAMTDDDTYEMVCNCGAANCRGIITGQDWRRPDLQEKYGPFMSWYLREKIKRATLQEPEQAGRGWCRGKPGESMGLPPGSSG